MSVKLEEYKKVQEKDVFPEIETGNTVKVTQIINGKKQLFEGMVIAKKHGKGMSGTITIRKVIDKVGVEKVFPLHSPTIEKVEITKSGKARKSKLYYIREKTKKVTRKKIK
jgi:large subunit ribosomal protein L19